MSSKAKKIRNFLLALSPVAILGTILIFLTLDSYSPHPGEPLYKTYCANCHGPEGEGLRSLYPPLAGSDYLAEHQAELPCILKNGLDGPIMVNGKDYNMAMPGVPTLTDGEVTNLVNYINGNWGNEYPHRTMKEVRVELKNCK